jgi:hypothetical protein
MIFLLFALTAFAADLRFTPYAEIEADAGLQAYRSAVHLFESQKSRCTATEVSSAGHLLTARHCLQKCLITSGVFQLRRELGVDYFVLNREKLGRATCPVSIDGVEENVVVEATSPGLVVYMDQAGLRSMNPALFKKMYDEGYTELGDFAIVRRPVPGGACVPLSLERPVGAVSSLGYPSDTSRPDGFNSDGSQLYYTRGEVLGSVRENACFGELSALQQERAVKDYDHPGAFMSTLDAIHGSSGSSVLNEKREVVGVFATMFIHPSRDPDKFYCRGSAKALSVEHIHRMFGGLKLECAPAGRE